MHAVGEVLVGLGVAAEEPSDGGDGHMRIEPEQLFHGETLGGGKFHEQQVPARLNDTVNLFQSTVEVLKVPCSIGDGYGVERVVGKRQFHAVLVFETNRLVQAPCRHLLPAHLHHLFADVGAYHVLRFQAFGSQDGKVARAGGNVQDVLWPEGFERVDGLVAPSAVDAQRQGVVQLVVGGSQFVEHALHLRPLTFLLVVGLYLLYLVVLRRHHFLLVSHVVMFRSMRFCRSPSLSAGSKR